MGGELSRLLPVPMKTFATTLLEICLQSQLTELADSGGAVTLDYTTLTPETSGPNGHESHISVFPEE